jgi:hypothetical protein
VNIEVWLGDVPPSLNELGARGSSRQFHRVKKQWQRDIELVLMASQLSKANESLEVQATLRFPTSRGRDTGNFQSLLEKAVGDALQNGGWLVNDTAECFRFTLQFAPENGSKRTTLQIRIPEEA